MQSRKPLVSIIINNYNYGQFLRDTIESALHQTYDTIEVIAVDDGSTDDSREIIASFGDQLIPVFKENGGQASAFNAGFSHCRGEVVFFLDSDDMLLPHIVERVAMEFQANPSIAKVQYRLAVIDALGNRTGALRPAGSLPMPSGDLRRQVLKFPDDISWQSTSGNAFAAWILRQIFPTPEQFYRICADYYLSNLPPLFGPVLSLGEVGGCYRIHGFNRHNTSRVQMDRTRQIIMQTYHTHRYIKKFADSLGLAGFPAEPADVRTITFLTHRIISLKVEPERHPIIEDKLWRLLWHGVLASLQRFDLPLRRRFLYILWFAFLVPAPRSLVLWLAEKFLNHESRSQFNKLLAVLH
jgi:glycosyltransferase involved in cell wall biosynthesis